MFERISQAFGLDWQSPWYNGFWLVALSFSFLSLAAFGVYLLAKEPAWEHLALTAPGLLDTLFT